MTSVQEIKTENGIFKIGSKIIIYGSIQHTKNVVSTPDEMKSIINDGKVYKITAIQKSEPTSTILIEAGKWWWSSKNIFHVKKPRKISSAVFDVEQLDI